MILGEKVGTVVKFVCVRGSIKDMWDNLLAGLIEAAGILFNEGPERRALWFETKIRPARAEESAGRECEGRVIRVRVKLYRVTDGQEQDMNNLGYGDGTTWQDGDSYNYITKVGDVSPP